MKTTVSGQNYIRKATIAMLETKYRLNNLYKGFDMNIAFYKKC